MRYASEEDGGPAIKMTDSHSQIALGTTVRFRLPSGREILTGKILSAREKTSGIVYTIRRGYLVHSVPATDIVAPEV